MYYLVMLIVAYVTLVGLLIGSAINAIVWRLYVGRKWTKGRSMCPECKHELAPKDLVPVLSWLALGGRCRYCKTKISIQYPLVELITAGLFGLSAAQAVPFTGFLEQLQLVVWIILLTLLIILAVYDAKWMILPNKMMYPAIIVGVVLLVIQGVAGGTAAGWWGPLMAALVAGGGFFAIVAFSGGRAMGGGDIKLAFLMGLVLGIKATALAMLVAFNAAAIVGLGLIALKLRSRRDHIPFGPFLVLGLLVSYLYGHDVVMWYWRVNGLG